MAAPARPSGLDHFWAVVPAGGAGTRLWPLSRASAPKFLHDLTGTGRSLLQGTVDRLAPLVGRRVLVVTGAVHRPAVVGQLPELDPDAIVAEPSPRDSMAAIGLAAAIIEREDPEAVIGSFAADQVVADRAGFETAVAAAVRAARDGWLVTLGITPTHASTAFGYIHLGDELAGHPGTHEVLEFVEKPDAALAASYLRTGSFRWNAGMFVVRPGVLLDLLADQHPDFATALRDVAADRTRLEAVWPVLPRIAIDHAVAEPAAAAGRVAVVPATIGWDDVGDFASLAGILAREGQPVTVLGDRADVLGVDSSGVVVPSSGRTVAVIGLEDVVVVDTPDALLVTTRARAQDVKQVVAALREEGRDDLV